MKICIGICKASAEKREGAGQRKERTLLKETKDDWPREEPTAHPSDGFLFFFPSCVTETFYSLNRILMDPSYTPWTEIRSPEVGWLVYL